MGQFTNLFNTLSKNISNSHMKKSRRFGGGTEARNELANESNKCKNFAAGYSKKGKKGLNQDCFVVWEEFGCQKDMIYCGVFDGHGQWGHFLSKKVRQLMPPSLLCNWHKIVSMNSDILENILVPDDANLKMFETWKKSYIKTCADVDQELQQHPGIDSFYSGSTALSLVRQGDQMIVANVGDSRAVIATMLDDGALLATQLTTDLKPNLPHESKRIAESRGRVYSCPDEPGVHRVWMPNGKTVKGPGLALSRAFGDYYIKDFGLISEPEVTQRTINSRDQFIILATDGVWDVMSNQEAVELVASTSERLESAKRLVECASRAWKRKRRAVAMDDISAICLFFHDHSTTTETV